MAYELTDIIPFSLVNEVLDSHIGQNFVSSVEFKHSEIESDTESLRGKEMVLSLLCSVSKQSHTSHGVPDFTEIENKSDATIERSLIEINTVFNTSCAS